MTVSPSICPCCREIAALFALALAVGGCSASDGAGGGNGGTASGSGGAAGAVGSGGSGASGGSAAGGADIGAACTTDSDCSLVAGATCYTTIGGGGFSLTFPGGYCSKVCNPDSHDAECGAHGGCTSVGASGGGVTATLVMCTAPCASDADCRQADGYHCQQILPGIGYCSP
jgi:hypothetical protein